MAITNGWPRPSRAYPNTVVVLFHVDADDRVRPEQDDSLLFRAKRLMQEGGSALQLAGHRSCSLITIAAIVDIFQSECSEPLEWAFSINEMMQPGAIVVMITPSAVKPEC
ncbi:MAG: hypothetical protein K0Q59_3419 [Paenibacillus sp.]|nr:hypothetical protein [Paenibacillus sp.]